MDGGGVLELPIMADNGRVAGRLPPLQAASRWLQPLLYAAVCRTELTEAGPAAVRAPGLLAAAWEAALLRRAPQPAAARHPPPGTAALAARPWPQLVAADRPAVRWDLVLAPALVAVSPALGATAAPLRPETALATLGGLRAVHTDDAAAAAAALADALAGLAAGRAAPEAVGGGGAVHPHLFLPRRWRVELAVVELAAPTGQPPLRIVASCGSSGRHGANSLEEPPGLLLVVARFAPGCHALLGWKHASGGVSWVEALPLSTPEAV